MEACHSLTRSGSQRSLGSRKSLTCSKKIATALSGDDDNESESGTLPIDLEAPTSVDSNEVKEKRSDSLTDEEEEQAVLAFDFDDGHQKIYVPLPGQTTMDAEATEGTASCRRMVTSGCAICLCLFDPEENITWSANPDCPHIFHSDCILHWHLAVGRKAQKRRLRNNPEMSDEEILSKICDFQTNCPCCRQNFCQDIRKMDVSASSTAAESDSDEEVQHQRQEEHAADDIETGSHTDRSTQ